ncbi:MAG: MBL fold metallo-hydrolase [Gammaproteobacteria bacterium]|jgi:flavorubredoxin|nr:MBL fold metallo-hydrolase [Gammaproteobacteria bacterium]
MQTNLESGTSINEIASGIYRISTPVPPEVVPGGFTFNQYLVADDDPLLYHTGPRKMFPLVCEAIASVLPLRSLRYIGFSHYEADECGSLNDFLEAAPKAEPLCSKIAKMVSVDDVATRPAHALADGEELSLGTHVVRWIDTPHLPHAWECGHLFETTTRTLFCGDLFTQGGNEHEPLTTDDILESSEAMRGALDYFSQTRRVDELMEKLAITSPRVLACMHGAAWQGDGATLLRQLAGRLNGQQVT